MSSNPSGTVTFLFTDIEGSTKLAQEHPDRWEITRAQHHTILGTAMKAQGGYVFQIIGDAFCVAFHTAGDALNAAVAAQRSLQSEDWQQIPIKVRMGLHTGSAELSGTDYRGYLTMAKVQRIMSAGYGEQVLVSNATAELLRGELPAGISLRDLGEHRLKGLLNPERLWQMVAPGLRQDFSALQTLNAIPNNLPVRLTSFVGRERDIAELKHMLITSRILTITGSGGTGKTRLSLQVAAEVLDDFVHGAWFVELAALTDAALIPQTLVSTLGLQEEQGKSPIATLVDYLQEKTAIIILDNCEHVVAGCAQLADTILRQAPKVKILTSSQEALNIEGEIIYRLPSLAVPDLKQVLSIAALAQYDAVRLFIERARSVMPSFEVNNANAPAVAQICYHLDGIPLAIELAAARVRGMKVEQIAKHLDHRFRLLTGGVRTALARHQTLHAMIDWSYSLLSTQERILFRRISVFAGGWTIEAAESVCAGDGLGSSEILELLLHLLDKSLILMDEGSEETRYYLLETVRQYGREKLEENEEENATLQRHLEYFMQLAEDNESRRRTAEQLSAYRQMRQELDNFRVALDGSLQDGAATSDCVKGLRLANAIDWEDIALSEGVGWLQKGLNQLPQGNPSSDLVRAKTLALLARFLVIERDSQSARDLLQESLCIHETTNPQDKRDWVYTYLGLAYTYLDSDTSTARAHAEAGLSLAHSLGDAGNWDLGWALYWVGCVAYRQMEYETASARAQEGLVLFRRLGDRIASAAMLQLLAWIEMAQEMYDAAGARLHEAHRLYLEMNLQSMAMDALGNIADMERLENRFDAARKSLEQIIAYRKDRGEKFLLAMALWQLGETLFNLGELEEAAKTQRDSLLILQHRTDPRFKGYALFSLAKVLHGQGKTRDAARLLGVIEVEAHKDLWQLNPQRLAEYNQNMQNIKNALSEEAFRRSYAEGCAMSLDEAIALVLEERHK